LVNGLIITIQRTAPPPERRHRRFAHAGFAKPRQNGGKTRLLAAAARQLTNPEIHADEPAVTVIRICPDCRINLGMTIGHYDLHGRITLGAIDEPHANTSTSDRLLVLGAAETVVALCEAFQSHLAYDFNQSDAGSGLAPKATAMVGV
jgi:hypothetical protein